MNSSSSRGVNPREEGGSSSSGSSRMNHSNHVLHRPSMTNRMGRAMENGAGTGVSRSPAAVAAGAAARSP